MNSFVNGVWLDSYSQPAGSAAQRTHGGQQQRQSAHVSDSAAPELHHRCGALSLTDTLILIPDDPALTAGRMSDVKPCWRSPLCRTLLLILQQKKQDDRTRVQLDPDWSSRGFIFSSWRQSCTLIGRIRETDYWCADLIFDPPVNFCKQSIGWKSLNGWIFEQSLV